MAHSKEQIQLIAESILPGFIPKGPDETSLIFHFTIPPNASYKVEFTKDNKRGWIFVNSTSEDPGV